MIKDFLKITKPGIIFGNLVTVIGGFFLASRGDINIILLITTMLGITLIIASGCVFNNCIDRDIDKLMERTKNRTLVQGQMKLSTAIIYACLLGICGTLILYFNTNILTTIIALIGLFVYVIIYSMWLKRSSIYGTLIGSISGAIPPIVGYCAVSNNLDLGAGILFLILSIWQMPHSYAIAIYRFNDYKNAKIPVLPIKLGIATAKIHMLIYTILFAIASICLSLFGYTGVIYLVISIIVSLSWIILSLKGFYTKDDRIWARKMFIISILIITILSVTMALDVINLTALPQYSGSNI